ncbi:Fatty acid synthase [Eumeta japonica]|uniref:Fatty acid synthase n=1 Tax=Eumeta variegata TaxID=151549 RepID=A0A4C1XRL3_EUMVA|nr:Fatty acid synthase [Eumeta japonica]
MQYVAQNSLLHSHLDFFLKTWEPLAMNTVSGSIRTYPTWKKVSRQVESEHVISFLALICKWKAESEKNKINLIITDTRTDSNCNLNEQLNKNLALMMYRNGSWGCEYYLPSNDDQVINPSTGMNTTVPGDTQSISRIEISEDASSKSVQVKYAGLTHYDVTEAAGATPNASDKGLHCMDYSGLNSRSDRVMGVVASGALAPSVVPDEDLLWPVPDHWTLEDAATVPQPYIHAFYCLCIKSKFQDESRILVHCGTGALGQAIISIALGMSCEVFTTVSSVQNKRFLKSLFPELEDNHICSCRDVSFEHVVMEQTNGEGCAFVVSCLDGELREVRSVIRMRLLFLIIKNAIIMCS